MAAKLNPSNLFQFDRISEAALQSSPSNVMNQVRLSNSQSASLRLGPSRAANQLVQISSLVGNNPLRKFAGEQADLRSDQPSQVVPSCTSAAPGSSNRSSTARSAAVQERSFTESQNGSLLSLFLPRREKKVPPPPNKKEEAAEDQEVTLLQMGKLVDGGMVFREKFMIRCYEVGVNRTASIESIANLLQEIGCNHAQSVGFSNDGFATTPLMRKKRLIWVTTRMHIEMDRYPVWGDVVEIDTWFQGEGNIVSRRDWIIKMASTGEVIGRGTSTWVTMNQDTRRLSKVPEDVQAEYMQHCPSPPRYALPSEPSAKIPKLEDPVHVVSHLRPRRNDLDMNQHVNNVTYIGWMLESIPAEVLKVAELSKITLEYRREVSGGEIVESMASPEAISRTEEEAAAQQEASSASQNGAVLASAAPPAVTTAAASGAEDQLFVHLLRLQDDGKEVNRGRTQWRTKNYCMLEQ